jgi:hypothetical protein
MIESFFVRKPTISRHLEAPLFPECDQCGEQWNGYGKIPISVPLRLKPQSACGGYRALEYRLFGEGDERLAQDQPRNRCRSFPVSVAARLGAHQPDWGTICGGAVPGSLLENVRPLRQSQIP